MCMYKLIAIIATPLIASTILAQESPDLGESVSTADLAALDYVILPNGDGLPPGSGNAKTGAQVFNTYCVACHGEGGSGGINDVLVGGHGTLTSDRPQKTVGSFWPYATTVFDYVRRAMPLQSPGVLSNDELYAVTAYLLFVNDVIGENVTIDASTLPAVEMPNRDNFEWAYVPE